ncbi:MAG: helix-turn-helix domain-containing protein [Sulfolobales archaeon]
MNTEEKVLSYLRTHPGATPREVADALGIGLTSVRIAINRLRELGYVIRSSRGGYVVRIATNNVTPYDNAINLKQHSDNNELLKTINELVNKVDELEARIRKLEDDVKYIRKSLPKISVKTMRSDKDLDKLLSTLKLRGIISLSEARELANKPLEDYINSGEILVIADSVVYPDLLNSFRSKFPIKVSSINNLSNEEVKLLEALIKSNQVYLFSGIEYRFLD